MFSMDMPSMADLRTVLCEISVLVAIEVLL